MVSHKHICYVLLGVYTVSLIKYNILVKTQKTFITLYNKPFLRFSKKLDLTWLEEMTWAIILMGRQYVAFMLNLKIDKLEPYIQ